MKLTETIAEFKKYLRTVGYAPSTVEGYCRGLDLFRRYLGEQDIANLKGVTRRVMGNYRAAVMEESIAMESKALKLRPVKRLFEYLSASHRLLVDPTEGMVETCRRKLKIGPVLTVDEVGKLLDGPDLSTGTGIRDRAVMEVLYSSGIRLGELLGLETRDVDLKERVVFVRNGKGGRQRVVPIGGTAGNCLKNYLEKVRGDCDRKNPVESRFFLLKNCSPMTEGSLRSALRKYRFEAGLEKPVSPHTFRRTCATHLLQAGADIRHIQELLGHRHLKTTQSYTRVTPMEVKAVHEQTHPGKEL